MWGNHGCRLLRRSGGVRYRYLSSRRIKLCGEWGFHKSSLVCAKARQRQYPFPSRCAAAAATSTVRWFSVSSNATPVSVWIQLYVDGCPLGPPIEIPIPVDDTTRTVDQNAVISIGNVRSAVKKECGSVLEGIPLSLLHLHGFEWTESTPTPVLDARDEWQSSIHGGATEEAPLIVYAHPKPPLRTTAPELDPVDEERRMRTIRRLVVGPMELRLPVWAHFLDQLHTAAGTPDSEVASNVNDLAQCVVGQNDPMKRAEMIKQLVETILNVPLRAVNQRTTKSDTTFVARLYRDADLIVHLEISNELTPLAHEPLWKDAYNQIKWSDDKGRVLCPHAFFTLVLTPMHVGIYGTIVNAEGVTQQWLTPLIPLVSQWVEQDPTDNVTDVAPSLLVNHVAVQTLMALRESIQELRQVVSSPLMIPDLPALGELVDLDEHLVLEYPMVRGTFVYRGKYGLHDVVVKLCQSYCIEAHTLLARERMAPKVYWYGTVAGGRWHVIVMKYYEGRPKRKLNDKQVAACECVLARLHELGFVHGDARSQNFVWTPRSVQPLLVDFDHAGRMGATFYPPSLHASDANNVETYYSIGRAVEPDHDFETLSTR